MAMQPDILCCAIADIDADLLAAYRALLSDDEQQRLAGYRSETSATEFIIARALLRTALAPRVQCDSTLLKFARDTDGKPHLLQPSSSSAWHFNLSHDHNWVALILSPSGAVGIDVEGRQRRNDLGAIAKRFFSTAENNALQKCSAVQWRENFLAIWTLKEALAKMRGCGLAKILSCSSITLDWLHARIDFELEGIARSQSPLAGWLFQLDESTSLAAIAAGEKLTMPTLTRVVPLRSAVALPLSVLATGNWQP